MPVSWPLVSRPVEDTRTYLEGLEKQETNPTILALTVKGAGAARGLGISHPLLDFRSRWVVARPAAGNLRRLLER